MAGQSHTTKTPHRMNQAVGRDALGFIARQTVATQDFRKAIYVGPFGKGFHKVRNPFSGEVYVVADGLGGVAPEPGSVVGLLSFSGKHGEVLATLPPAGFGGAQTSSVTMAPVSPGVFTPDPVEVPPDEGDLGDLSPLAFCWDDANDRAYIAFNQHITDPESFALHFRAVDRDLIPHSDATLGVPVGSISLTSTERSALRVYAMQTGQSSSFYVFFYIGEEGSIPDDTALMHLARFSSTGAVMEHITYDFPIFAAATGSIGSVFIGSHLYAAEYIEGASESTGGIPFENSQRVTKRSQTTLLVTDEYDVPDPSFFDGWDLQGSSVHTLVNASGAPRAFIGYQDSITGDYKFFYVDFDSTMTPTFPAAMDGNPFGIGDPSIGLLNDTRTSPGGGVRFVQDLNLYSATTSGSSRALVLAAYDNDGRTDSGVEQISSTETLILGVNTFVTSILTSSGQQLP